MCGHEPPHISGHPALAAEFANSNEGFRPEYFEQLAGLEAGNFWFRSRNALILMLLKRYCPAMESFLEIGCGTGFVLTGVSSAFPSAALTGAEMRSAGLEFASRRLPGARFMQMDARKIPFESHFDALGAFDVIEHIEDDAAVLEQARQALKPGGVLLLTVPQHPGLWSKQDELACHVRRYTAAELREKTAAAGFEVVDAGSFVALLLPVMWLSRLRPAGDDAMGDLRIGKAANYLLSAIMSIELGLDRIGMRFPAGGSLFLVARKRP